MIKIGNRPHLIRDKSFRLKPPARRIHTKSTILQNATKAVPQNSNVCHTSPKRKATKGMMMP